MNLVFVNKDEILKYEKEGCFSQPKERLQTIVLEFANSGKHCAIVTGYNPQRRRGSICSSLRRSAKDLGLSNIYCRTHGKVIYLENELIGD